MLLSVSQTVQALDDFGVHITDHRGMLDDDDFFKCRGDHLDKICKLLLVRFAAATRTGTPLPNLRYKLRADSLTDPMGMEASDTTATPAGGSPDAVSSDSSYDWSASSSGYYGGSNSGMSPQDPYSSPYSTV